MAKYTNFKTNFASVPNEVLFSNLSFKAKGMWAYLQAKPDGWDFSAGRIAKENDCGRSSVLSGLRELLENSFLERNKHSDGKVEYILTVPSENRTKAKVRKSQSAETAPSENRTHIKERGYTKKEVTTNKEELPTAIGENAELDILDSNNKTDEVAEQEQYGNHELNNMMEYWSETTQLPITARIKQNRYACANLLKRHGTEALKALIRGVAMSHEDKYAPRIYDFASLQSKTNELILWGKKKGIEQNNAAARF